MVYHSWRQHKAVKHEHYAKRGFVLNLLNHLFLYDFAGNTVVTSNIVDFFITATSLFQSSFSGMHFEWKSFRHNTAALSIVFVGVTVSSWAFGDAFSFWVENSVESTTSDLVSCTSVSQRSIQSIFSQQISLNVRNEFSFSGTSGNGTRHIGSTSSNLSGIENCASL